MREKISRQNNFKQEGETYRNFEEWEREELILNLGNTLASARKEIQDKMIENLTQCDPDYGKRVAESIWKAASMMPDKGPIGSTESNKAVKEAEEVSREARPY